jgi:TRAP-type C4-dicarboxylate transport system permease small subunit
MIQFVVTRLITLFNAVNVYLIFPMLVTLILADILLRFFLNSPLIWAHEVSGLLLICLFFLSIPSCIQSKQLLHVDLVYRLMGSKQQACASYLSLALLLGFSVLLICQGYLGIIDSLEYDGRAYTINIPYWPFYGLITFVGLTSAGQCLLKLCSCVDNHIFNSDDLERNSVADSKDAKH